VATLGDSMAFIGRADDADGGGSVGARLRAVPLAGVHRVTDERERKRVEACGAVVDGEYVVSPEDPDNMISVTRTMGDWNIRAFGVSDEPEILSLRLSDRDRLLVLATDGLWDAENTKPDDVVNAARRTYVSEVSCGARGGRCRGDAFFSLGDPVLICFFCSFWLGGLGTEDGVRSARAAPGFCAYVATSPRTTARSSSCIFWNEGPAP